MTTKRQARKELTNRQARDDAQSASGYIPIPEAAKALNLSPARVYELASSGLLTRQRVGGAVYVSLASLDAYQKQMSPGPGWIPIAAAARLYKYARTTLIYRAKRGQLELRVLNRHAYLYQPALDALFRPRKTRRYLSAVPQSIFLATVNHGGKVRTWTQRTPPPPSTPTAATCTASP